jgi:hypothetical protein
MGTTDEQLLDLDWLSGYLGIPQRSPTTGGNAAKAHPHTESANTCATAAATLKPG